MTHIITNDTEISKKELAKTKKIISMYRKKKTRPPRLYQNKKGNRYIKVNGNKVKVKNKINDVNQLINILVNTASNKSRKKPRKETIKELKQNLISKKDALNFQRHLFYGTKYDRERILKDYDEKIEKRKKEYLDYPDIKPRIREANVREDKVRESKVRKTKSRETKKIIEDSESEPISEPESIDREKLIKSVAKKVTLSTLSSMGIRKGNKTERMNQLRDNELIELNKLSKDEIKEIGPKIGTYIMDLTEDDIFINPDNKIKEIKKEDAKVKKKISNVLDKIDSSNEEDDEYRDKNTKIKHKKKKIINLPDKIDLSTPPSSDEDEDIDKKTKINIKKYGLLDLKENKPTEVKKPVEVKKHPLDKSIEIELKPLTSTPTKIPTSFKSYIDKTIIDFKTQDGRTYKDLSDTEKDLFKDSIIKELNKNYINTDSSTEYGSGKVGGGLWSNQLQKVMDKYPQFMGVVPIDEIHTLNVKPQMGFICNLSKSGNKGTHWVACYIDSTHDRSIEYYNSFADEPPKLFMKEISSIVNKLKPETYLKFKVNKVIQQASNTNNCGLFCIKFLIDRFTGIKFKECTKFNEIKHGEEMANNLRGKLKSFGYI